jgi:predicted transcriptional regulator
MTVQISISTGDRRLLGRLLRSSMDEGGVVASKFRAENPQFFHRLNALESNELLRKEDDRYYLTLVALTELSTPEARDILREAKQIYRLLAHA